MSRAAAPSPVVTMVLRGPHRLQTPCKQLSFWGRKRGFAEGLLTRDFLYSIVTFLTDAPLAQLDRALDYESSGQRFESSRARHPPPIRSPFRYFYRWMIFA
jgi:hypothetical protein